MERFSLCGGLVHFLSSHVWEPVAATSSSVSTVTPIRLGNAWGHHLSPSPVTLLSRVRVESQDHLSALALLMDRDVSDHFLCCLSYHWTETISPVKSEGPRWKASALRQSIIASLWVSDINRFPERRQWSFSLSLPLSSLSLSLSHCLHTGIVRG